MPESMQESKLTISDNSSQGHQGCHNEHINHQKYQALNLQQRGEDSDKG